MESLLEGLAIMPKGSRVRADKLFLIALCFVGGLPLAGLAAIHFIWLNPILLGPFALMIGMIPLVLVFKSFLSPPHFIRPNPLIHPDLNPISDFLRLFS